MLRAECLEVDLQGFIVVLKCLRVVAHVRVDYSDVVVGDRG